MNVAHMDVVTYALEIQLNVARFWCEKRKGSENEPATPCCAFALLCFCTVKERKYLSFSQLTKRRLLPEVPQD